MAVASDSVADFDLMLITEYADSINYSFGEERFTEIIKAANTGGPLLLYEKKPGDFRQILFNKTAVLIHPVKKG